MLSNLRRRLGVIAAVSVLAALVPVLSSSPASAAPAAVPITTLAALDAEATYLAWLDFRETGLKQDEIMDRLVNVGGVGLYSGTEFGEEGMNEYTEVKSLHVDDAKTRENKPWYDMLVPQETTDVAE